MLPAGPMTPMNAPPMTGLQAQPTGPRGINVGGILQVMGAPAMLEAQKREAAIAQHDPVIQSLAAHVRQAWTHARTAKEQTVEQRMFQSVRQRRGEYDPLTLSRIRQQGGSEIYMMLTSTKCRGAGAWLRDVLLGQGQEKPWSLKPTPLPSLPPQILHELRMRAINELEMYMTATGAVTPTTDVRKFLVDLREEYFNNLYEEAKSKVAGMERQMEDQLVEGGFLRAVDAFIDDLTTFPAAVIKGPVIRNKPRMTWKPNAKTGQFDLDVEDQLVLEWERVDPFMIYPSPASEGIEDGFLIERHKLRKQDLQELMGVEGYDEGAIRLVLDDYGAGGLVEWLTVDSAKADAEGKSTTAVMQNSEHLIDAIQYWGTVSGQLLLDFGMEEAEVPDPAKNYNVEVWLIGRHVIKATLNYHPLGLKPYYKASYEDIPGSFWGNSVADLVRDCQDMCNSAGRALANNMGIASGPQVTVNTDRLPAGEDLTQMFPWKIWQHTGDPMGSTSPAVDFFQPSSNVNELMQIYEKFSILADEFCSIPRYMTGDSPAGGAGRTASGMSMLMNNANKSMKQVVSNVDVNIFTPLLERLYFHNMKYSDDPNLKGDVQVVARGASSVVAKESAQVRRNEFLTVVASNPILAQILGVDGLTALLREAAKNLDMDPDKVVPSPVKATLMQVAQQQQALTGPQGSPPKPTQNAQTLQDGAPISDNYSPRSNKQ